MRSWITLAVATACVACGASSTSREPAATAERPQTATSDRSTETAAPSRAELVASCADQSADTKVGAQIIDRGAAIVFTTSDDVATLRRRAADLTLPVPADASGSRIDNIQHGVRLVFEVRPSGDVAALRREVVEQARKIAKGCGLVLAAPSDRTRARLDEIAAQQRPAEAPTAGDATGKQKSKAAKDKPHEAKPEKPAAKKPAKAAAKTDTKSKPKAADKPKTADKPKSPDAPKEDGKPKEDKQPVLPRLPGPHPDPISPSAFPCVASQP